MKKLGAFFKRASDWLHENVWGVLAALLGIWAAIFLWKSSKNKVQTLEDAIQIRAAAKAIAKREAKAAELIARADAKTETIEAINREVAASKRRVMEIQNGESLDGKSDSDIARMFTDAGF